MTATTKGVDHAHAHRRRDIRAAFERAAHSYDQAAMIQREICTRLAAFGEGLVPGGGDADGWVLDAGCGTGFGVESLRRLRPGGRIVGLDLAPAMLGRARMRAGRDGGFEPVCADLEHLPLAAASIDLLWSSLAVQWCRPGRVFEELGRVLAPGGIGLVATLGPDTLWELRDAFASVDDARHTIDFHTDAQWVEAARAAGLEVERRERCALHARAADLRGLLRDIKAIGAATIDGGRRRTPLGRQAWLAVSARYERHRLADGLLPATYDTILLALRKPGLVSAEPGAPRDE